MCLGVCWATYTLIAFIWHIRVLLEVLTQQGANEKKHFSLVIVLYLPFRIKPSNLKQIPHLITFAENESHL